MASPAHKALASILIAARQESVQVRGLPPELYPPTNADGYIVNDLVSRGLGWPQLGWKIAGTNPVMQSRLKTGGEPIYGRSFQKFEAKSPARFSHAELLDPIVECEFFFRLGDALPARARPYGADDVAASVAAVHAGIEIAECRFPLNALPPMPAILADGAANGRYVVGAEIPDWRSRDLAAMPVRLTVNGAIRRRGNGAEIMGTPINALVWLANARSAIGDGLASGCLVSTGTATGMLLARPGDRMTASFGGVASVEVVFEA